MIKGYEFSNDGLSEAIIKNDQEAIELFVKADININLPDNEGYSALDRALKVNDKDAVILLSQAGGETKKLESTVKEDIQQTNSDEVSQICIAQKDNQDNLNDAKLAPTNQQSETDPTLNKFCEMVNANKLDEVAKIAKTSPLLNTLSQEGLAPLHYAIFNDNPAMVHVLLNGGADVNMKSSDGLTPLDIAILNNQKIIAKELLESGGAMSEQVARELMKFGCVTKFDATFGLYDASYDDIFATMQKIQEKINSQK